VGVVSVGDDVTRIYICHRAHRIVSSSPLESCPAELKGVAPCAVVVCRADLHGPFVDLEDHEDALEVIDHLRRGQ